MALAASLIRRGALQHADRVAVRFGDEQLTFAQVNDTANRIAHHLLAGGVTKGTHVALLVGNGLWSIPMEFAAIKSGLVRVPLNARLSLEEHAQMVRDSHATVLVHDAALADRAGELAERVEGLRTFGLDAPSAGGDLLADPGTALGEPGVELSADDPTLLLYTSGTTGTLKAVLHTQGSYGAICANILANLVAPRPDSVMLHAASLIHASGTFVLPYWIRGGCSAILPAFAPDEFARAIPKHRVTEINLVPTMFAMLLGSGALEAVDLSSLRRVIYGASPMPHPLLRASLEAFGPILAQYYGQTEAPLCIAVLSPADHADESLWGTCGQPSVDADVRLVDEAGADVAAGQVGEIAVRAPFTMQGYHDAEELNASTWLPDGWLRTRDLGQFDERGYLRLVDRTSDMIITGGYNVYPREVEDAIGSHPAVAECAVVSAPDETWVEAVTAFITLRPGAQASEQEIITHVRDQLAAHKAPKSVHFVESIPKSPVGKILRRALRDPLWEREAQPEGLR
jgi:acyl-CoA synthetase (AMP-forming)/AMP-acid ligase II